MTDRLTPLFGAVLIAWIFSVCVHEFAHALVAYWGGDRSVREKGYLGGNPLSYIHPFYSILLPCLFLLMGGLPLPGAAVQIDRHALRGRIWETAVSAAGPLANLLLFFVLALLVHPSTGLVDPAADPAPAWAVLLGALTVLQAFAFLFNLIPLPPLDGFGIIEPYLDYEARAKLADPRLRTLVLFGLFFGFFRIDAVMKVFMDCINAMLVFMDLPFNSTWRCYNLALFGHTG